MADAARSRSRAELEKALATAEERLELTRRSLAAKSDQLDQSITRETSTRAQFEDLKSRLATSESDNQRMRGYIARVQEDDVVREELVSIGEPGGEQKLVPKRKTTVFGEPYPYMVDAARGDDSIGMTHYRDANRPRPRHWVAY